MLSQISDFLAGLSSTPSWSYVPSTIMQRAIRDLSIRDYSTRDSIVLVTSKDGITYPGPLEESEYLCRPRPLKRVKNYLTELKLDKDMTDAHAALIHNLVYRKQLEFSSYPYQALRTKSLKTGDLFIDIGAFRGYVSLKAAIKVGPLGKVWSFEPIKKNCDFVKMCASLNQLNQIEEFNKAISTSSQDTITFFRQDNQKNSEIKDHLQSQASSIEVQNLSGTSLSDKINSTSYERVVISLTTNGTEFEIAEQILKNLSDHISFLEIIIPIIYTRDKMKIFLNNLSDDFDILIEFPWLVITKRNHLKLI